MTSYEIIKLKRLLKIGDVISAVVVDADDDGVQKRRTYKYKVIKKYPHFFHAVNTKSTNNRCTCIQYSEIRKIKRKSVVVYDYKDNKISLLAEPRIKI